MPDLVWTGRGTTAQLLDLPGKPRRTVFTSVRRSGAQRPAILAAREILASTAASIAAAQEIDTGADASGAPATTPIAPGTPTTAAAHEAEEAIDGAAAKEGGEAV
jgi:hypothetical protein